MQCKEAWRSERAEYFIRGVIDITQLTRRCAKSKYGAFGSARSQVFAVHSVIGVDEVGRGSWAGPLLVVAARAKASLPDGLADSKILSKLRREELFEIIQDVCDFGEGWVQPEEIDEHGLSRAMRMGVSRALVSVGAGFDDEIILDGNVNYCPVEFTIAKAIVRADALHEIVSAASIYAKVKRDRYMSEIARFYPNYKFDVHVGYGTELHRTLLQKFGVSALHRRSYRPVKALL